MGASTGEALPRQWVLEAPADKLCPLSIGKAPPPIGAHLQHLADAGRDLGGALGGISLSSNLLHWTFLNFSCKSTLSDFSPSDAESLYRCRRVSVIPSISFLWTVVAVASWCITGPDLPTP